MRRILCVGVILLLGIGLSAKRAEAQSGSGSRGRGLQLEQNYPNPFNPETRIPFGLGEDLFRSGRPVRVTIRIVNPLLQLVAIPTALDHPDGLSGQPVDRLEYSRPGRYVAFWNGLDKDGRKVGSGIYFVQVEANGLKDTRPMTVAK
jgi:hypothetical protein